MSLYYRSGVADIARDFDLFLAAPHGKLSLLSLPWGAAMQIINIHQAKTHLSRLVDLAFRGEAFIIAKAGKPLVRVSALDSPSPKKMRRLGFMLGEMSIPDDFDRMGAGDIQELFEGAD